MSKLIFGDKVTVTEDVAGRMMRDKGIVTKTFVVEREGLEFEEASTFSYWVHVVFQDDPEGVDIEEVHLTNNPDWLPEPERLAVAEISELLRHEYQSQRPKRDKMARRIYNIMATHFERA